CPSRARSESSSAVSGPPPTAYSAALRARLGQASGIGPRGRPMSTPRRTWVAVAALLALAGPAAAGAPPVRGKLGRLLQSEPINLANWAKWSPRLRAWSGAHVQDADPAFQRAFGFIKKVHSLKGDRPILPKGLDRDAVAWMLLAGAFLGDSRSPLGR